MKYAPCGESAYRKTIKYCAFDRECLRTLKDDATWKRTYDIRDNSTCNVWVASCPC